MREKLMNIFIFIITLKNIFSFIIIPFQTYNPLLTKDENIIQLIKSSSDKYLFDTMSRNLIYSNLNFGESAQTISTFLEMSTKDFILKDLVIDNYYKPGKIKNSNFDYGNNNLLRNIFRKIYYSSKISNSYKYIEDCHYHVSDTESIKTPCGNETVYLYEKNNIDDKGSTKTIDFYFIFSELEEFDQRPAILGLNYYNNFIHVLKEKKEIDGYYFSFNYTNIKEESGQLIIGNLPHIFDKNNYEEKNLRTAKLIIDPKNKWSLNFDIYISSKNKINTNEQALELEENGSFLIEEFFITGSQKYFTYIQNNFFAKYISQNMCEKWFGNKPYYSETFYYIICNLDNNDKRKEFFSEFPDLILFQREMNHKFILTAEDLFTIVPDGKRIIFNVDFIYNSNKWILGKPFLKKYQLIFNSDLNSISYYIKPENRNINKEVNKSGGNTIKIFIIIFLIILAFSIGIIFGRAICIKYNRKIRANELEDNFSYISNDVNKESNKIGSSDINIGNNKGDIKSKYYNLN